MAFYKLGRSYNEHIREVLYSAITTDQELKRL
jgi:hypothetical protein